MPRWSTLPPSNTCVCGDPNCPTPRGYCHCGCGDKTPISAYARKERGLRKGDPQKFIIGHQSADREGSTETGEFKIDNKPCRLIPLSRRQYAIVDAELYPWLNQWKWHARFDRRTGKLYASRSLRISKKHVQIYMHRLILGLEHGSSVQGDHVDTLATTDNRLSNLRQATRFQNAQNQRLSKRNTSGFKGICFHRSSGLWHAKIECNGKVYSLKYHRTKKAAHAAYCEASRRLHGEYGRTK
jgi:hypothetical protein